MLNGKERGCAMTASRRQPGDLVLKKLHQDTKIAGISDITVCDFWAWAYSDILSNTNRGVFAEHLVAHALGADAEVRVEWDAYDCLYKGEGIEVKSAAYLQSYTIKDLSIIILI